MNELINKYGWMQDMSDTQQEHLEEKLSQNNNEINQLIEAGLQLENINFKVGGEQLSRSSSIKSTEIETQVQPQREELGGMQEESKVAQMDLKQMYEYAMEGHDLNNQMLLRFSLNKPDVEGL